MRSEFCRGEKIGCNTLSFSTKAAASLFSVSFPVQNSWWKILEGCCKCQWSAIWSPNWERNIFSIFIQVSLWFYYREKVESIWTRFFAPASSHCSKFMYENWKAHAYTRTNYFLRTTALSGKQALETSRNYIPPRVAVVTRIKVQTCYYSSILHKRELPIFTLHQDFAFFAYLSLSTTKQISASLLFHQTMRSYFIIKSFIKILKLKKRWNFKHKE